MMMKYQFLSLFIACSLLLMNCNKEQVSTENSSNQTENDASLEQKSQILKSDSGEEISLVYYAEGTDVAVKMTKNAKLHTLLAKGTDENGNPVFTDGEFAWILGENGKEGFLQDKNGEKTKFK